MPLYSIMAVNMTRSATKCPLFGQCKKLDVLTLLTYDNVMKACLWESHSINKYSRWKNISQNLTSQVEEIWASACIPIVSTKRIQDILKNIIIYIEIY